MAELDEDNVLFSNTVIVLNKETLTSILETSTDELAELIQQIGWQEDSFNGNDVCIISITVGGDDDTFSSCDMEDKVQIFEDLLESLSSNDKVLIIKKVC